MKKNNFIIYKHRVKYPRNQPKSFKSAKKSNWEVRGNRQGTVIFHCKLLNTILFS